jgi:hypothetical protein
MDESALQHRLATVERRQRIVLALLVGLYLVGGLWLLVAETSAVTIWHAVVAVVFLGVATAMVGMYRRREAL